ncbi:hypothetical protein GCM10017044_10520 [Kordiimonas sediminis]|uniref:Uncharacterized protein n=1 Tax=Kordiimonas sediminis TaxID=1735581 RepID=A0A919AQ62_9PROT|nr:hypothetical protein [Kordiimonas sediminis]GHF17928.1 hypothetical protein GCM10017044_10520 [Kordiimonas sediminis]
MSRFSYVDDSIGFEDEDYSSDRFRLSWPLNEVALFSALNSYMTVDDIAEEYGVSTDDVIELCERYQLDWD